MMLMPAEGIERSRRHRNNSIHNTKNNTITTASLNASIKVCVSRKCQSQNLGLEEIWTEWAIDRIEW